MEGRGGGQGCYSLTRSNGKYGNLFETLSIFKGFQLSKGSRNNTSLPFLVKYSKVFPTRCLPWSLPAVYWYQSHLAWPRLPWLEKCLPSLNPWNDQNYDSYQYYWRLTHATQFPWNIGQVHLLLSNRAWIHNLTLHVSVATVNITFS